MKVERTEEGCGVSSSPFFPPPFFSFCLFEGKKRVMMYKSEGKNIKSEEKVEVYSAASIIIVLLDWRLSLRSVLRLCRPTIGSIFAFVW